MLAIYGIYDGEKIRITDKITEKKKYKVVITFIEEISEDDAEIRNFTSQTNGLEFWNDSREDLYEDYLKKEKK